jgi:hypothetical protein
MNSRGSHSPKLATRQPDETWPATPSASVALAPLSASQTALALARHHSPLRISPFASTASIAHSLRVVNTPPDDFARCPLWPVAQLSANRSLAGVALPFKSEARRCQESGQRAPIAVKKQKEDSAMDIGDVFERDGVLLVPVHYQRGLSVKPLGEIGRKWIDDLCSAVTAGNVEHAEKIQLNLAHLVTCALNYCKQTQASMDACAKPAEPTIGNP